VKKTALGFAAAIALGLASFSAPASAMPLAPAGAVQAASDAITVQYHRHRHVRPHVHHRKVCTTRRIVSRGHHGRPIVRHVRVCR
jgi:hypothetical protein